MVWMECGLRLGNSPLLLGWGGLPPGCPPSLCRGQVALCVPSHYHLCLPTQVLDQRPRATITQQRPP